MRLSRRERITPRRRRTLLRPLDQTAQCGEQPLSRARRMLWRTGISRWRANAVLRPRRSSPAGRDPPNPRPKTTKDVESSAEDASQAPANQDRWPVVVLGDLAGLEIPLSRRERCSERKLTCAATTVLGSHIHHQN